MAAARLLAASEEGSLQGRSLAELGELCKPLSKHTEARLLQACGLGAPTCLSYSSLSANGLRPGQLMVLCQMNETNQQPGVTGAVLDLGHQTAGMLSSKLHKTCSCRSVRCAC